jgi:TonB family protein
VNAHPVRHSSARFFHGPQWPLGVLARGTGVLALLCLTASALAEETTPLQLRPPVVVDRSRVWPIYPLAARRGGFEGTTILRVNVLADGQVGEVTIEQSAGHAALDEAAKDAVRQWRFEPARRGSDAVPYVVRLPVKFALEGGAPVRASAPPRAGVVARVEGEVHVRRAAFPAILLRPNDDLFLEDTFITGEGARLEMILGGKAAVTLQEASMAKISERPGRSTLELLVGALTIKIPKSRMRRDEEVEIRTPNTSANVRGIHMSVECPPPTPGGLRVTDFDVVDGPVTVFITAGEARRVIPLNANEGVTITGEIPGPIRPLRTVPGR